MDDGSGQKFRSGSGALSHVAPFKDGLVGAELGIGSLASATPQYGDWVSSVEFQIPRLVFIGLGGGCGTASGRQCPT